VIDERDGGAKIGAEAAEDGDGSEEGWKVKELNTHRRGEGIEPGERAR
jgi:hypothetical protein